MDRIDKKYTNGEITVFWKPRKCIHATTCYRELIEVFNPRKRPWVNMQGAPTKDIIRVVNLCPTQALSFKYNNEIEEEVKVEQAGINEDIVSEVRVMEDGPLVLKGNFVLYNTDGEKMKPFKITSLCRCGESNNLPYCDGMHRKTGFSDQ